MLCQETARSRGGGGMGDGRVEGWEVGGGGRKGTEISI